MTEKIKKKHFNEYDFKRVPIRLLRKYRKKYHKCFKYKRNKPLCIGIFKKLIKAEEISDGIEIYTLKRALKYYTNCIQYQYALYTNNYRYNLKGRPVGKVTEKETNKAYKNIVKGYKKMNNKEHFYKLCPGFKFKNDEDKA